MDVNLNIDVKDIAQVKEYLKDKESPVDLHEIADRIALFKTRDSRAHKVKIYNPNCEYKVGDLIFKEYPGHIPTGSKTAIEISDGVVLTVQAIRTRFGINEIILKYEGTSDFKKYIAYLERQKIELLLPHKQQRPCEKPEYLAEEIDPRRQNAPLEKRDLTALTKKLIVFLNKEPDIALIGNKVLLKNHLKTIEDDVFEKIREFLKENKKSEHTEFFVEHFARINPSDDQFNSYCFSLSHRMLKDYRIDFQQTQETGWGKWNMISVLYYMKKDSPISDVNPLMDSVFLGDKKNLAQRRRKFEEAIFPEGLTNRFYLTQREIMAGAIRLRPGFYDLGDSIEVEVLDGKYKKSYLVYYYKEDHLMLGFKEIFEKYKALQGTIISFEMLPSTGSEGNQLVFNIRVTKKGTIADHVQYSPEEKAFIVADEKVASPAFVFKAMFLEAPVFKKVHENLVEFRRIDSLNKLIHKIFLEFGVKERNYEIHILRLFHILDLIYPMDLKVVEEVILSNPEFVPEEKMPGIFYLDSESVSGIEEEETKRKEVEVDELKQKRDEGKRKKLEQERRIKEEIRRKREERRRNREEEMWEKERLLQEAEDKKLKESQPAPPQDHPEPLRKVTPPIEPGASLATKTITPVSPSAPTRPAAETRPSEESRPIAEKRAPAQETPKTTPTVSDEDAELKKEHSRKVKKKIEEEKPPVKVPKRTDRKADDEAMSEDDIKSTIELERLKEEMRNRTDVKKSDKKKEIAYKDKDTGFGGIFASKLDEIVKKDTDKDKKMKLLYAHWMQELDAETIHGIGIPAIVLMENASRGAAEFFADMFPRHQYKHVLVVAGKGNNGGDGLAVGRMLFQKGYQVEFLLLADPEKLNPDPKINLHIITQLHLPLTFVAAEADLPKVAALFNRYHPADTFVIDALFGTGLNAPIKPGLYAETIHLINRSSFKVAAIDLPSGLSESFLPEAGPHVTADVTATFQCLKLAHIHPDGNLYCGTIRIVDIGIPHALTARDKYYLQLIAPDVFQALLSKRQVDGHKGSYGHCLTLCGSMDKPGAGILSSYAVLKAGAGLCTAAVCPENRIVATTAHPELMTLVYREHADWVSRLPQFDAVLAGPGLGDNDQTAALVSQLLQQPQLPVLLDADAVNVLQRQELKEYLKLRTSAQPVVITPHLGEFSRIIGVPVAQIRENRIPLCLAFAREYHVYVVLKGHHTIVVTPGGQVYVNQTGNPGMATAGSGDVLSGMMAGLLAQFAKIHPLETIVQAAVFLHGYAGDIAASEVGQISLTAGDIIHAIPRALGSLDDFRSSFQFTC